MQHRKTYRGLSARVSGREAARLRIIKEALLSLKVDGRASNIYINEIADAIEGGLLLAAIGLATTLMELWLRDLLVINKVEKIGFGNKHERNWLLTKVDKDVEGIERGLMFIDIAKELLEMEAIESDELEWLKTVYKRVRNPLHHGISGRIVDPENRANDLLKNAQTKEEMFLGSIFGSTPHRRANELEDFVCAESAKILGDIVNFLAAHQMQNIGR